MTKNRRLTINQILKKIYYDPENPGSYGGIDRLFRAAKKKRKAITRNQVINFLESQDTYTLHKPVKYNFERRKTFAKDINYVWQLDLIDLGSIIGKQNRGFRYLLVAIDVLSRYARVVPIKRKFSESVAQAFEKMIKKVKPIKVQTDDGGEFLRSFRKLLREKGIVFYSTSSDTKASICERFNRSLQNDLFRYFTAKNSFYYLNVLQ